MAQYSSATEFCYPCHCCKHLILLVPVMLLWSLPRQHMCHLNSSQFPETSNSLSLGRFTCSLPRQRMSSEVQLTLTQLQRFPVMVTCDETTMAGFHQYLHYDLSLNIPGSQITIFSLKASSCPLWILSSHAMPTF